MAEEPQNNNAYWAANVRIILISMRCSPFLGQVPGAF